MEDLKSHGTNLKDDVIEYIDTSFRLFKIEVTGKSVNITSSGIVFITVVILFLFVLLFSGIGLGWWLGRTMNNMLSGFCIIAGIYAILGAVIWVFRKGVFKPIVRNILIRKIYG
jgi:hypothetical protein